MDDLENAPASTGSAAGVRVGAVADDQWETVAWLWQLFRHDLAPIVMGMPYADGRYQAAELKAFPSPEGAGYLAWRAHPKTGEDAPVAFVLVDGLEEERRSIVAFWVSPVVRRKGVGRLLAIEVLTRHEGPWSISFQHDNANAAAFWRSVADAVFGPGGWSETQRPVPGPPGRPARSHHRVGRVQPVRTGPEHASR